MNIVEFAKFKKMVGGGSGGSGGGDDTVAPGLYQTGAIARYNKQGAKAIGGMMITPWDELLSNGILYVDDGVVSCNFDKNTWTNLSSEFLAGDLIMPNDGSIIKVGSIINESYEGHMGFTECNTITGITIPDSVISIGFEAFCNCKELTTVTFGKYSHLETILYSAFLSCHKLESIDIPDFTKEIASNAFASCKGLTSVTLPESLTLFGQNSFSNCTSLTSIVIPNVANNAIKGGNFRECTNLTSATIPVSMTKIPAYLFKECTSLTIINYEGTISQWQSIVKEIEWDYNTAEYTVYCIDGAVAKDGTVIDNSGDGKLKEVASATEMDSILANATSNDVGKMYIYSGESTDAYETGAIYIIKEA